MEAPLNFNQKFVFPTKASMTPLNAAKRFKVKSNHFMQQKSKTDFMFVEWFVSFITKPQLAQYLKNHMDVRADAVAPDSRFQISTIWAKNRKEIDKVLGRHIMSGNTLYSSASLTVSFERAHFSEHPEFVLIIEKKNELSSLKQMQSGENKQELLRYLNSNLKNKLAVSNFVEIGRNKQYYNKDLTQRVPVGDFSYLVYRGFKTAYDIYEGGLKLLIDYSTRIVHESSVWDDVQYYRKQKSLKDDQIIEDFIVGKSVWTTYGSQKSYKIDKVMTGKTIDSPFPNPEFKSYKDYFLKRYKIQLKDSAQFLLVHHQKINERDAKGKVISTKINEVFLPSELVRSTGIPEEERSNYLVMKAFAEYTCLPPDQRFKQINDMLSKINSNTNEKTDPMQIKADATQNEVSAFYLPKPKILMEKMKGGAPDKDKIDLKSLYSQKPLNNWLLVTDTFMDRNVDCVIDNLISSAPRFKITMSEPCQVAVLPKSGNPVELEDILRKKKNFKKPDLIFFLIGKRGARTIYKKMKAHFNSQGIPLQFFVNFNPKKDMKANSKYSNLVLQMVNKLGSNLWCVDRSLNKGLVLGAATANASKGRSITSMTSQFGNHFSRIFSTTRLISDQSRPGIGKAMSESVKEHVDNYVKANGQLPQNLVLYRQGASEEQVHVIVKEELQRITDSLHEAYGTQRPKLLLLVVTKKLDDRFAIDRNNRIENPDCGLIVDEDVVKSDYANFFMVAQFVNQGSANPTHYAIAYNETAISMGELQGLTYDLCWAYTNWMGPIKIPSPLQYANKLAGLIAITLDAKIEEKLKQTAYFL